MFLTKTSFKDNVKGKNEIFVNGSSKTPFFLFAQGFLTCQIPLECQC